MRNGLPLKAAVSASSLTIGTDRGEEMAEVAVAEARIDLAIAGVIVSYRSASGTLLLSMHFPDLTSAQRHAESECGLASDAWVKAEEVE